MTEILTAYGPKPKTKPNAAGNREEVSYIEKRDKEGHPYLEKNGVVNTYEKRQTYKEEYDIYSMMERYANGDLSVMKTTGTYIDASAMPTNFHEAYNVINSQKEKFDGLPVEIKQKFGNDWVRWASMSGTDEWLAKMGINKPATPNNTEKEVKPENGES